MEPKLHMLGDRALLFTFSDSVSNEVNDLVLHLSSALENLRVPGIIESQPAYSAICIHFDPHVVGQGYLKSLVKRLIRQYQDETGADCKPPRELVSHSLPRRLVELPVVYGGEHGPDLPWAAQHLDMDPEEIVKRHTSRTYWVYMIGFTPGFPYMGGMDESLTLPRLPDPRKVVPAGSVGIAGSQTGIYSMDAPGGWRLIGKTPVNLFDAGKTNPSLLRAGDEVRFVPISQDQAGGAHAKITYGKANPEVSSDTLSTMAETLLPHPQTESLGVPAILVENPGFFTIVVDRGRHGYRKMGVPVSGAADLHSYHQANLAVGNKNDEAALEMTLLGGRFRSMADITVAVAGAHATVTIDGSDAHVCQPVAVPKGSVLEVGPISRGCRAYLAVAGGLDIRMVLGSASTYLRGGFGGYCGRPLKPGDVLSVGPAPDYDDIRSNWSGAERPTTLMEQIDSIDEVFLRIVPGPEATEESLRVLCSSTYTVRPESDRMGLRLDGPKPMDGPGDILSSVVVPGTIQVPSDGRPILLLADAQTTGGYRRLGTVVSRDLSLAGQLWPGARVRFRTV